MMKRDCPYVNHCVRVVTTEGKLRTESLVVCIVHLLKRTPQMLSDDGKVWVERRCGNNTRIDEVSVEE